MDENFFLRDTRTVARELLGVELVRKVGGRTIRSVITETEAYRGFADKASHASRGKTPRNTPMFGPPGTIYVYLIYGMYWCLNLVTEREGYPAAVLIRGITLLPEEERVSGPGKVCRALSIDKNLNAKNIFSSRELFIRKRIASPDRVFSTPRIGVAYAGESAARPWRYFIKA